MSYTEKVRELEACKIEKKRLSLRTRQNNKRITELEEFLRERMEADNQPVGKIGTTVFFLDEKPKTIPKSKAEKEESIKEILRERGLDDIEELIKEIEQAQKGEKILVKKVKSERYETYIKKAKKDKKNN